MDNTSVALWMIALTVSICMIVIAAAMGEPSLLLFMSGLVSLGVALLSVRENASLTAAGASRSAIAASTARNMGVIWLWGAIGILLIYLFILQWREWWQLFLGLAFVGVLSLFFGATLRRDAEAGRDDETMLKLGRYLTMAQLVGMVVTVVGLLIDPDKQIMQTTRPDWAANNIFICGAIALAAISAHALMADKSRTA